MCCLIATEGTKEALAKYPSVSVSLGQGSLLFDYGRMYFVNDQRLEKVMKVLQDFVYSGSDILCVSRMHPDMIAERWPGKRVETIWLSERVGQNNVSPEHLSRLRQRIVSYLKGKKNPVAMIDGLEYLSLFNDQSKVQMFVEQINDAVMESRAILLIPIDPRLFDQRTLARLQRFAEVVS